MSFVISVTILLTLVSMDLEARMNRIGCLKEANLHFYNLRK